MDSQSFFFVIQDVYGKEARQHYNCFFGTNTTTYFFCPLVVSNLAMVTSPANAAILCLTDPLKGSKAKKSIFIGTIGNHSGHLAPIWFLSNLVLTFCHK